VNKTFLNEGHGEANIELSPVWDIFCIIMRFAVNAHANLVNHTGLVSFGHWI